MKMISFIKYQGAGNDFIMLDNRDGQYSDLSRQQIAQLCDRRFGIGGDGLIMLENEAGYDFRMRYHNADGGLGSFCGNGSRCISAFARSLNIVQDKAKFIAADGPHESLLPADNYVEVRMKDVGQAAPYGSEGYLLDTGSPHLVLFRDQIADTDVFHEGRAYRYNDQFREKGVNVNFVETHPEGITVRTYERGVEDETLSCGTGVTASSISGFLRSGRTETTPQEVNVKTKGGQLRVKFTPRPEGGFTHIWLCGPAEAVFIGNVGI